MKKAESLGNWFYEGNGQRNGPVSEEEIARLIRSGMVSPNNQVWAEGFSSWKPIEATELNKYVDRSAPPPLSGELVNNTMAWLIALLPLIGGIFNFLSARLFFGGMRRGSYHGGIVLGLLPLIVLFAIYLWISRTDEKRIKEAGHDMEKISTWAWLIPPVYLYQRAKLLGQNLLIFCVWIGCFVLSLFV